MMYSNMSKSQSECATDLKHAHMRFYHFLVYNIAKKNYERTRHINNEQPQDSHQYILMNQLTIKCKE